MNIKRNKIPKKTRLFSSKPRSLSMKQLPIPNRPKTGIPRNMKNIFNKKPAKLSTAHKISTANMFMDFRESLDFRSVRPKSRCQDRIFNTYWQLKLTTPETIFKNKLFLINEDEKNTYVEKTMQEKMQLYKFPQINWTNKNPINFLSHVGGNEFNISQTMSKITTRPVSSLMGLQQNNNQMFKKIKNRPITAFNRAINKNTNNYLKRPNTAIHNKNIRPKTAFSPNKKYVEKMDSINEINSPSIIMGDNINENIISKDNININIKNKFEEKIKNDYNYKDEFFNEESKGELLLDNTDEMNILFKSNVNNIDDKQYSKYKTLIKGFEENQLQNYSIKIDQADTDLLELFDRSQKTNAATKAKDVNFDYCSTHQRIASFIEFSQHLKLDYLVKISKDINRNKKNLLEYQSKHNIQKPDYGELLTNDCPHFRDSNSLFHGFMPFEETGMKLISDYNRKNNIYDPLDFLPKYGNYYLLEERENPKLEEKVRTSIKNYNKYLDSDKFRETDIKKFNINSLDNSVYNKIDEYLIYNNKYLINIQSQELEQIYSNIMKRIIMDYIIRSPFERQRLNIKRLPRKVLPSSYTIAQHGSFNRRRYQNLVDNYNNSKNFLENNLSLCNISISGLVDWTNSFNHIHLIYLNNLNLLKNSINTIHLDEFYRIQESYINKIFHFIRDIYYRGAILITKKNKALKRRDIISNGKWTFKGFIPNEEEFRNEYLDDNYGMYYEDQLQDFWTNINMENLIDIRLTPSNVAYTVYFAKKQIDLSRNDYDEMSPDAKIKLNNSVSTYCLLFLRKLTEKALNDYLNFFENYKSNKEIYESLNEKKSYLNDLFYENEDDIRLPKLISFFITPYVDPLISLKVSMNEHGEIKIENDLDQINDKITKIIDTLCNIFSSLPTSHFLEFKKILPSQREKIVKEHSAKLNEFFNSDKNKNKSFMEDYYKTFCPNLILEQSGEVESNLNVMSTTEPFVIDIKGKIYRKLKEQYSEIEECVKIYEPLKDLKSGNLDIEVKNLGTNWNLGTPDYSKYMKTLKKIKKFKNYLNMIPIKLNYSMFVIDNREVIQGLRDKLSQNTSALFASLENQILRTYDANNDKFLQIIKRTDVKLNCPQDVVDMENIKNNVNIEIINITNSYEDSYKIMIFLIKENDLFEDSLIKKICLGMKNYYKFKRDKERIDKIHQENKQALEVIFNKERKELEDRIETYVNEINKLDQQTHITEYDKVNAIILYLKEDLTTQMDEEIKKSLKDEELLTDIKNEGFENYNAAKTKLLKLSILWENIQAFYREKKLLIHNFNEDIELDGEDGYIYIFEEIKTKIEQNRKGINRGEEVIINISKIIEDEINHISDFLGVVKRVFEAEPPIDNDLRADVMIAFEDKKIEQSCRETLFSIFSQKA